MDKFRRFGRGNPDKVRLARLKGELVDRPQAIAHVFKLARSERDAWLNWPARVSAQMAAKLGVDAHSMHVTLEAALRKCGGGNNCCIALQSISRLIRGRNLRLSCIRWLNAPVAFLTIEGRPNVLQRTHEALMPSHFRYSGGTAIMFG
jgi:hypothetical protein